MASEKEDVIFTKGIAQCPFCKVPTKRKIQSLITYFYDEKGNNVEPDKYFQTTKFNCLYCKKIYEVGGDVLTGRYYKY